MEEALYRNVKLRIKREQKHCFFCGKEIKKAGDVHHLKGRDGSLLYDKSYLVHVHRTCHDSYHFDSIHKWTFRDIFLSRLQEKDVRLYQKELNKLSK